MSKRKNKEKDLAIKLRKSGKSYSQIREVIKVSKSTLSLWLKDLPLSDKKLRELRDLNPIRIEKYQKTMKAKREANFLKVFDIVEKDIGLLDKRDYFIAGLFLYWGEGLKATRYTTSISNTDPKVLKFFITWLNKIFNIKKEDLSVRLHLYKDMSVKEERKFWCKELGLTSKNFQKDYIKDTKLDSQTYKNGFGHGTCNVMYYGKGVADYVKMSLKYIRGLV